MASWGRGTDNVGITGYQIQLLPQNGTPLTVDVPAIATSHEFTGLTPTRYVEVRQRFLREHPDHALEGWPLPAD